MTLENQCWHNSIFCVSWLWPKMVSEHDRKACSETSLESNTELPKHLNYQINCRLLSGLIGMWSSKKITLLDDVIKGFFRKLQLMMTNYSDELYIFPHRFLFQVFINGTFKFHVIKECLSIPCNQLKTIHILFS